MMEVISLLLILLSFLILLNMLQLFVMSFLRMEESSVFSFYLFQRLRWVLKEVVGGLFFFLIIEQCIVIA